MQSCLRREAVRRLAILVAAVAMLPSAAQSAERAPLAIKGYDPVAYFTLGKAIRGKENISLEWDERRYHFASAEHRERFKADPVRYAPQFPDYCAMSLARGEVVEANPENWLISDGKLYMFGKPYGPGIFQKDLARNVATATQNRGLIQRR